MIEPNNWSVEEDPSGFTVKYDTDELKNPMEEKGTYQATGKQTFRELLDSPEMEKAREVMAEAEKQYAKETENWWNDLSYDDQLKAFFYITSMIHKGDVEERGSYRYFLYDLMNFGPDAYSLGMQSGYLLLHNLISDGIEYNNLKSANDVEILLGNDVKRYSLKDGEVLDLSFSSTEESDKLTITSKNFFEI